MAAIDPQTASWNDSADVLDDSTPDSSQVINNVTENTTILVTNDSAASIDVTLKNKVQDEWGSALTTQDQVIAIAAGKTVPFSGPFLKQKFVNVDKELTIEFSATADVVVNAFYRGP